MVFLLSKFQKPVWYLMADFRVCRGWQKMFISVLLWEVFVIWFFFFWLFVYLSVFLKLRKTLLSYLLHLEKSAFRVVHEQKLLKAFYNQIYTLTPVNKWDFSSERLEVYQDLIGILVDNLLAISKSLLWLHEATMCSSGAESAAFCGDYRPFITCK